MRAVDERVGRGMGGRRWFAALAGLTVAAVAIRLFDIGAAGVWFDEAYHVALVREPSVGAMLDALLANPPSSPLYPLLLRVWVGVAGESDTAIRLPSALAGALAVPATAWLAAELDGRRSVAIVAAVFVTVSPYALEFSQEAAPYMLASLLTTLALAAGWRWRRTCAAGDGWLAAVTAVFAIHAHYAAGAVLGIAWLLAVRGADPAKRRHWLAGGGLVAVAWTPWAAALVANWLTIEAPRATLPAVTGVREVVAALAQYVSGTAILLDGQRIVLGLGLGLAAVLVLGGWLAGAPPRRAGLRVALVTAAVVFAVPAIAAAVTGRWLFVAHFSLLTLPAVAVAAAAGAAHLAGAGALGRAGRPIAGGLLVAAITVSAYGVLWFRSAPPHGADGLRELAADLDRLAASDDRVLVTPAILSVSLARYTDRPLTGIPADVDLRNLYGPAASPASADAVTMATRRAASAGRVWLVGGPDLNPFTVVAATLRETHRETIVRAVEFATLIRFDP